MAARLTALPLHPTHQVLAELGVHFSWPLDQPAGPGRGGSGVAAPPSLPLPSGPGGSGGSGQLASLTAGAGMPRSSSGGGGGGAGGQAGGLGPMRSTSGESILTQRLASRGGSGLEAAAPLAHGSFGSGGAGARLDTTAVQRTVAAQAAGAAVPGSGPPGGFPVLTRHHVP